MGVQSFGLVAGKCLNIISPARTIFNHQWIVFESISVVGVQSIGTGRIKDPVQDHGLVLTV